ncbi:MAG: histidine phosphatase family protein, partial [Acidimicrobiales bacterium]
LVGRRRAPVVASPMSRAVDTATLAGFGDLTICDDLREWDYGVYEGRTTADIRREVPDWSVWTHRCPGGETVDDVGARADRVIALAREMKGDVALFGHGHQLRVLAARWCGLMATEGRVLALAPGSISMLSYERETPVIGCWNQVAGDDDDWTT